MVQPACGQNSATGVTSVHSSITNRHPAGTSFRGRFIGVQVQPTCLTSESLLRVWCTFLIWMHGVALVGKMSLLVLKVHWRVTCSRLRNNPGLTDSLNYFSRHVLCLSTTKIQRKTNSIQPKTKEFVTCSVGCFTIPRQQQKSSPVHWEYSGDATKQSSHLSGYC